MNGQDKDDSLSKAKTVVYRLLKFRLRSEYEIAERLKRKNFSNDTISKTIQYFKQLDLINDPIFAQQWTESRLKKPFGPVRIRYELAQKGIDKDIIQDLINRIEDEISEEEIIKELVLNRITKYQNIDSRIKKQRLFNYLTRKGFRKSSIFKVLRTL